MAATKELDIKQRLRTALSLMNTNDRMVAITVQINLEDASEVDVYLADMSKDQLDQLMDCIRTAYNDVQNRARRSLTARFTSTKW